MNQTVFHSGCAYWPRLKGPHFLAGGLSGGVMAPFDRGEIVDDLSHIAEAGFDFVRVALPWESAQPEPQRMRTRLLDHLVQLLDSAEHAKLTVQLVLCGRLGGTFFVPDWLLAREAEGGAHPATIRTISNRWETPWPLSPPYGDGGILKAQRYLWQEIATNLAMHPALTELDLGAGGLLTTLPPITPDAAFTWWESLSDAARASAPPLALLYSDQTTLLTRSNLPKLQEWQQAVGRLGFAVHVRAHPQDDQRVDERWVRFVLLLARTLAHASVSCSAVALPTSNRAYLKAEPTHQEEMEATLFREDEQARFFAELLPALHADGVASVCHAIWADAPPALATVPPFDSNLPLRHSGLLRADGTEKEALRTWQQFHIRTKAEASGREARALDLDEEEWYRRRNESDYLLTLYQRFINGEI